MIPQLERIPDVIGPAETHIMLALLRVHAREGRVTFHGIAAEAGRNTSTVFSHCWALRQRGLISWEDGRAGTMRPLVDAFPVP